MKIGRVSIPEILIECRFPHEIVLGHRTFVFALLAAFEISQFVTENDWNALGLIVIGIAGLAFAIRILNNWRQGLYIFFGWLFFADFARKYLGNNMAIYFAKDFLVLLVYVSFLLVRRNSREKTAFRPPFLARHPWFLFASRPPRFSLQAAPASFTECSVLSGTFYKGRKHAILFAATLLCS